MFRIARPGIGFVLSVVAPAVVIFASTVATITYALRDMAGEVNRTELSLTSRTAEAAVAATLRRMASTHSDYAVWDDAARRLYGTIDQQFVDESFVSSTSDPVFFDTAYLVDRDGGIIFAYHNGEASDVPIEQAFSPAIERFVRELPSDGVTYDVRTALVRGVWGLSVIAVGPVVPFAEDFTPRPTAARYLIFGKAFDEAAINRIAEDYLISGLTITKASGAQTETPLLDPDGNVLAALSWPTRSPGTLALDRLRPRAIEMFILLGTLLIGLIGIAARSFVNVCRGEARARHAATHDALSGLPNRTALVDHLRSVMAGARHRDRALAILYLDLDGFKEVNDSYGHDVGDLLLRKVAAGFETLAGGHLLVRLGGDEFAIVVADADAAGTAAQLGDRLVRFFAKPFDIEGRVISISASVGIALVEGGDLSVEEALRRADVAMYQAKQQGRNRVCAFDDSLDSIRLKRMEIGAQLRRALNADQLTMYYQPIYSARDGFITSVEALVRWPRGEDHEPISPAEFIPIAEETGLIDELGAWTMRRACEDARAWPGLKVAVNVSPAQFRNPQFAESVDAILKETAFPAECLGIEITETYLITHPTQASAAIDAVRARGVTVALDDFGVGYSSIGYLRSFAFDTLKLDRSLIANIDRDPHAQRLVQATVALAAALNLDVTAEGVETEEEATLLRLAGCDSFQGFFFGRPVPAAEITAVLSVNARLQDADRWRA